MISRVLLNPCDRVLMEEPHYTRCAFMAAGAELVFSPVDDQGIRVPTSGGGRRRCRLAYVTPSHQFPTGAVLAMDRRQRLIGWAAREGAFIVEGHFDRHLRRTTASNAARRQALAAASDGEFGDRATVCGASAGLHLMLWLRGRRGGETPSMQRHLNGPASCSALLP